MSDDAIQLRDQVGVLRRRWLVVVVVFAVAVGLGLLSSLLQTPMYVASTEVQLAVDPASTETSLSTEQVATEARAVTSFDSLEQVVATLGLEGESAAELFDTVTVEPDDAGAAVLTISTTRDDAGEAQAIANQLAVTYLDRAGTGDAERLAQLNDQVRALDTDIADLNVRISNAPPGPGRTALQSERRILVGQRDVQVDRLAAVATSDTVGEVLRPAALPSAPASPKPLRTAGLAGVLGLLLGVGAAYLRDYFDDVVRDERGFRSSLPGLPVLGSIPHWGRSTTQPTTLRSPSGRASEAYRAMGVNVRTLLDGWQHDHPRPGKGRIVGRVLLVTSATQAEGKTSTAVNLAVVAAQAGLRVVLVDADLRRPRVGEVFDLNGDPGLADVLADRATARQGLAGVGLDNLLVLPGGNGTAPAPDLLASPQRAQLLELLSTEADLVVIDCAAVLGVADALEVAKDADLTVLAVREGVSRGGRMTAALQRLEQVGAKVAGVVVTDAHRRGA